MLYRAYIIQKDNSIIIKKVQNPSKVFTVEYPVDNEIKEFKYKFDRTKVFSIKKFLSVHRIIFYEHGNLEPLDAKFNTQKVNLEEIGDILHTGLFRQLLDSTKIKKGLGSSMTILGIVGIIALLIFMVISKVF